ncbi:hypothetical protein CVT26_003925 [Gymnopilus dilepis]|uniref:Uncharacterized protein n=1 Tax=Gymnopilus dilepis TaxID=231916 RepID=A0A409X7M2_9AGAR|nr:hypothetical protein CVT26_003925 [Gymnopilus dilepis]
MLGDDPISFFDHLPNTLKPSRQLQLWLWLFLVVNSAHDALISGLLIHQSSDLKYSPPVDLPCRHSQLVSAPPAAQLIPPQIRPHSVSNYYYWEPLCTCRITFFDMFLVFGASIWGNFFGIEVCIVAGAARGFKFLRNYSGHWSNWAHGGHYSPHNKSPKDHSDFSESNIAPRSYTAISTATIPTPEVAQKRT